MYIAALVKNSGINQNAASGMKETEAEAIQWAQHYMQNNHILNGKIIVFQAIKEMQYQTPPIVVKDIGPKVPSPEEETEA